MSLLVLLVWLFKPGRQ